MKTKIRRSIAAAFLFAVVFSVFTFAAEGEQTAKTGKVGFIGGGILDAFCADARPGGDPEYCYAAADMPLALQTGKIDAYVDDELSAIAHCKTYDGIRIDKVVYSDHYGFIFNKSNADLCEKMSEFIRRARENGTLDRYREIWIDSDDEEKKILKYDDLSAENGTLNIAIAATMPPMIYVKDGQYAGYEVALLVDFCREYGYGAQFSNSDFSSVMAAVTSGVSDIGAASISITEERKNSMLFSESHVEANAVSVVRKETAGNDLTLADYAHSRIGVLEGSVHLNTAAKYLPEATTYEYASYSTLADALDTHKIDAYIIDETSARNLFRQHKDHAILTTLEPFSYAFALPKEDPGSAVLQEQLDNFINKIRENGELKQIEETWLGAEGTFRAVDLDRLKSNSRMITFAIFVSPEDMDPFVSKKDGAYGGYEVDILARFCAEYGYDLDINEYSFDGMLSAVENGKCDIAAGEISVTEKRQEPMLFSTATYEAGNVLVTLRSSDAVPDAGFFTRVKDSFHKTFIRENRWKLFLQGILTTFLVSLVSVISGTLIAYLFYLLFDKKKPAINRVITGYCELIEKTPAVVILMILYYLVFGSLDIHAVTVAALGLSMKFSVRVFGLFCIGVDSIPKGQLEAALALSYSPGKAFNRIIFPQAVMRILSGYKSNVVNLIEETAVVGYIAVQDLTKISDIIRSRTYEAFFPLIVSALFYVLIAVLLIAIVKKIEFHIDPRKRTADQILKGVRR